MNQFKPAIAYLPHRLPMVLIETVHQVGRESAQCSVEVSRDSVLAPFIDENGVVPAWFAIEMMAQTIGVWSGWHAEQTGKIPLLGLLLGTRGFKSTVSEFSLGSHLLISIDLLLQDEKLANFDCRIELNGNVVTQAKLNVYQPDEQEIAQLIQQGSAK
jgi:predicted hotdog family 3-hydroxylacyl-ACP dehydratase